MARPKVILVANDVVPGMGMPVAAPGLRVFGLAAGLREQGFGVSTVVMADAVRAAWSGRVPPPLPPATRVIEPKELGRFAAGEAPVVVVLTNSNHIDDLRPAPGLRLIVDLFAPKMLELACRVGGGEHRRALDELRARKLRAISAADGFIFNGPRKRAYFLSWLLAAGRDPLTTPLEPVFMCLPSRFPGERPPGSAVRFSVAGYRQAWSLPGSWLEQLAARLDPPRVTLDLVLPAHWGEGDAPSPEPAVVEAVRRRPGVAAHPALRYGDFLDLMAGIDVAVDLFEHTLEREYAVVTRTVVALACGVPVVHPPFTEVSPLIAAHDAGWLVDAGDRGSLDGVLDEILESPEVLAAKAANARRLWGQALDPSVVVQPLADMIERLAAG
jgi:hypothetical protein